MKVRVIKAFRDKDTKSILKSGQVIEVTEERFSELTGPQGIFVEEIKEEHQVDSSKFENMNKTEIIEYAKGLDVELNMEITKAEMIEILLKK